MKRFRWLFATSGVVALSSAAVLALGGVSASASSSMPTLTVALNGKTVVVGGSTVSGAVNVQTTVTKEAMGATFLFRLNPGETPAVFAQAGQAVNAHHGDLNYLSPYGSIVFDSVAPKGTSTAQALLTPGTYLALDAGGNSNTPPHTAFTVTQSPTPASLPNPKAIESSIEFGFKGPTTLHDGELVRFVNDGFLVHMDVWERVKSMAGARQLMADLLANKGGKQLNKLITDEGGFANPMSTGGMVQLVITEKPGIYVQDCFMNTQDGRSHTQLGMERIIKIVK